MSKLLWLVLLVFSFYVWGGQKIPSPEQGRDDKYVIRNKENGLYLSASAKGNLVVQKKDPSFWNITKNQNGTVSIIDASSHFYLTPSNRGNEPGIPLVTWDQGATWLLKNIDDYYAIANSLAPGLIVTPYQHSALDNTPVIQWHEVNAQNALWKITEVNQEPKPAFILISRPQGLFSELDDVWGLVNCFEQKQCSALKVDFGKTGLYYDPAVGPNWFDYYFLPIDLGNRGATYTEINHPYGRGFEHPEIHKVSLEKISSIVKKYIIVKPEIEHDIQNFVKDNFSDKFVIGVHYRGTDKAEEAPRVAYTKVSEEIRHQAREHHLRRFKIFLATDEKQFLDFLETEFPRDVITVPGTERSTNGNPLHIGKDKDLYKTGKDAIIDCILLSRTNLLIRTSSNLSRWSTYFNPKLKVIELSKRHGEESLSK